MLPNRSQYNILIWTLTSYYNQIIGTSQIYIDPNLLFIKLLITNLVLKLNIKMLTNVSTWKEPNYTFWIKENKYFWLDLFNCFTGHISTYEYLKYLNTLIYNKRRFRLFKFNQSNLSKILRTFNRFRQNVNNNWNMAFQQKKNLLFVYIIVYLYFFYCTWCNENK